MGGSMDKKTVIFPADYPAKENPFSLFSFVDPKAKVKSWNDLEDSLAQDLGLALDLDKAKKLVDDSQKRPEMVDPYVKVGVVGADLVFRVKQKRNILKGGDIESDVTLLKAYNDQKKKKNDRYLFKTKGPIEVILDGAEKKTELFKAFEKQCAKEFCPENLEFLVALRDHKDAKGKMIETENKEIYGTFIEGKGAAKPGVAAAAGDKQVNLPAGVKAKLDAQAKANKFADMKFDEAGDEIEKLLLRDTWPRFKATPEFMKALGLPAEATLLV